MGDEFAQDIGRKLCLQLCSLSGYGAASDASLDVLADLVKMFLRESSTTARSYAENAGRTEINAQDIVMSLDDMGFSLKDMEEFEATTVEVPLGATVPKFPVQPPSEEYTSFKMNKEKPPEHVPSYLPSFPAEHTYRETALYLNKQQDEKTKVIRAHEVKRTTEEVLIKLGHKDEQDDPYLSSLFEGEEVQIGERSLMPKHDRKMASNWTKLLLGRLQQNDDAADMSSRLLPTSSLSSVPSTGAHDLAQLVKKRRKDKDPRATPKEKKSKTMTDSLTGTLTFNIQPTSSSQPDPVAAESINDNPSIATEDLSISQGLEALPVVQEEGSLGTDDIDIFGTGPFPTATEDVDSNDVIGEESSAPGGTPLVDQAPEEIVETREASPRSKSDV